ncbi:rhodopsin-like [Ruditapes philippinarum]|uniref:rhodopsin-like n=1 Tax=Ruditapes philippinarum TaxID=129788 RepID=UPI00295B6E0A|nr:rhodopsin-like [Ruditapes philippinarum]
MENINSSFKNDTIEDTDIFNNTGGNHNHYYYYYYYYRNSEPVNIFDFLPESYRNARIFLYKYLVFIIWIISFLGNTLVILVLMKKRNRGFSTSIYLKGLAFADLSLNTSNTLTLYFTSHGYIKPPASDTDCHFRNVFSFAIAFITTWMLVVISIERVISVWMPYKVKRLCTENGAYIVNVFIWLLFFGLSFLHEHLMVYEDGLGCQVRAEYYINYHNYLIWVLTSVKFLIPYAIIFICTAIIMITLVNRKIRKHSTEKRNRGTSVNIVLMSVNIVFLTTNAPYIIFYLFASYTSFHSIPVLSYVYYFFWYTYLQVLNDCNSAVNVFVYFLVGSRFRKDVIEMLCVCLRKKQAHGTSGSQKEWKTRDTVLSPGSNESNIEKIWRRENMELAL